MVSASRISRVWSESRAARAWLAIPWLDRASDFSAVRSFKLSSDMLPNDLVHS